MKHINLLAIVFNLIILMSVNTILIAQTPTVSNVEFKQRIDGSNKVDIYYDVNNSGGGAMTVIMEASDNDGSTWTFPCVMVTGDVGSGITSGTGKYIVWDFAAEHPQTFGDQFKIKIIADDGGFNTGIPCPGEPTVIYAGKTYNTVLIGTQCWLRENLDVGTMIPGSQEQTNNTPTNIIEKYCYDDNPANCTTYGGLYQWNEAMKYVATPGTKGICPTGWHIPTLLEFQTLSSVVGGDGNALKREDQGTVSGQGTNTSGFSALLAGYRNIDGSFVDLGYYAYIWSSTEYDATYANYLFLWYVDSSIYLDGSSKEVGFSVRCLKD